jgi:hypothetical protein
MMPMAANGCKNSNSKQRNNTIINKHSRILKWTKNNNIANIVIVMNNITIDDFAQCQWLKNFNSKKQQHK